MTHSTPHTISIQFRTRQDWPALGPGWAALAGFLAAGFLELRADFWAVNGVWLIQFSLFWLLVDPILGSLRQLLAEHDLWQQRGPKRAISQGQVKPLLPYVAKNSAGYRASLWWHYLQTQADGLWQTGLLLTLLALGLAAILGLPVFVLALISILAAVWPSRMSAASGHFWQSVITFLLPYLVGLYLMKGPGQAPVLLGLGYWVIYLGSLRLRSSQPPGNRLVIVGQAVVALLLFALSKPLAGSIAGMAAVFALLLRQNVIRQETPPWPNYVAQLGPFLTIALLVAARAIGAGG